MSRSETTGLRWRTWATAVFATACGAAACSGKTGVPSDAELRERCRSHRAELEALRGLIADEPRLRVIGDDRVGDCWRDPDGTWGCPGPGTGRVGEAAMLAGQGLAPDRYARYRSLLAAVGGHRVERLDGGQLEVTMFSAGLAPSSVVKDLVYAASPPAPLVADTDHDRPIHDPAVYAACDGAWYVHRSSN